MALDQADLDKITALIKGSLTAEVLSPIIGEAMKPSLGKLEQENAKLRADLDAVKAKPPEEKKPEDGKKPEGGAPAPDAATAAELAALRQRLEATEKARADEVAARKVDAVHVGAREALQKAGVPAERVGIAMAFLKDQGVIDVEKGGWKGKDKLGMEAVLGLDEGAAAWLKSDDGKLFLPPSPAQGTGGTFGRGGPGAAGGAAGGAVKLSDLAGGGLGVAMAAMGSAAA
jgi:hypothetical protein